MAARNAVTLEDPLIRAEEGIAGGVVVQIHPLHAAPSRGASNVGCRQRKHTELTGVGEKGLSGGGRIELRRRLGQEWGITGKAAPVAVHGECGGQRSGSDGEVGGRSRGGSVELGGGGGGGE